MINGTMCFLRSERRTLFIHRTGGEEDIHNGWYVPPGGHTERGERGIDCILREFKQETGLKLEDARLRALITYYNDGRILGGKRNPEDWCVEVYQASRFTGTLREEHPNAKLTWVADNDLAGLRMYPADREILKLLEREGVHEVIVRYLEEIAIQFEPRRVDIAANQNI